MFRGLKKKIKYLLFPDLTFSLYKSAGKLEKLGSEYGGWIIPVSYLNQSSVCYMAGAGEDISFDFAVAKKFRCQVLIFDPTPRAKDHYEKVIKNADSMKTVSGDAILNEMYDLDKESVSHTSFHEIGLWKKADRLKFFSPKDKAHISHSIENLQNTEDYFVAPVKRLSEIMVANGHNKLDILKLDIEGAEFEVISSIIEDKIDIKILCVEFHHTQEEGLSRVQLALKILEENNFVVLAREDFDFTFGNKKYM